MTFFEDTIAFLALVTYLIVSYVLAKYLFKILKDNNPLIRIVFKSFLIALLFGFGIAGTGGDPGFAFPAPNIIAISLMLIAGFFTGVYNGLIILGYWWILIFSFMIITYIFKKRKRLINN